jgi:hypothetical protein
MKILSLRNFMLLLSFILSAMDLSAQLTTLWVGRDQSTPTTPDFLNMSTTGNEYGRGVVVDGEGAVYTSGYYYQTGNPGPVADDDATYLYKFTSGGAVAKKIAIWSTRSSTDVRPATSPLAFGGGYIYLLVNLSVPSNISSDTAANSSLFIRVSNQAGNPNVGGGFQINGVEPNETKAMLFKFDTSLTYLAHTTIEVSSTMPTTSVSMTDLSVDKDGNVYVVGEYNGRLRFSGPQLWLESNTCVAGSGYDTDAFTVKYAGTDLGYLGAGAWHVSSDGTNDHNSYGNGVATDGDNVYFIGHFNGPNTGDVDIELYGPFDWNTPANQACGSSLVTDFATAEGISAWISKFDLTGNHAWTKIAQANSSGGPTYGRDIVAKDDSCYVVLETNGNLNYHIMSGGLTNLNYNTLNSATYENYNGVVVAKVFEGNAPDDKFRVNWLNFITTDGGSSPDVFDGNSLYIDGDNKLYVIGELYSSFSGSNTLYGISPQRPGFSSISPIQLDVGNSTQYQDDIFIVKYRTRNSLAGFSEWGACIGGSGSERPYGLAVDFRDNTLLAGQFSGQTDFDPTGVVFQRFSIQGNDAFVAKYGCFGAFIAGPSSGCVGEFITLTASPECNDCVYNYQWEDVTAGTTITGGSYTFTGNLGVNRIILTAIETGSGCISRDTLDITFNSAITVSATPDVLTVCNGNSGSFTASVTPNLGNTNFSWFDFSTNALVGTGATFTTSNPGGYTVVAEANGCEASFNVNLNNYPVIDPRVVPETPVICGNNGTLLEVLDCPGCGFVWTPPPLSASNSSTNTILADLPGSYQVNILDQFGCTQTKFTNVTTGGFLSPPIFAENVDGDVLNSICNGEPLVISTTSYTSCPTCTFEWSDGSTGPYTFAFADGTYNVTVTDLASGCVGTSSDLEVQLSNLAQPVVTAAPNTICAPEGASLEVSNPCVGCTYTWYDNSTGFIQETGPIYEPSSITTIDTCTSDYDVNGIMYSPAIISTTSFGLPCGDCVSGTIPIGFDFDFYCNTYNEFRISSNGFITFDIATIDNGCCSGDPIPLSGTPNNLIAFAWEDLNPSSGGGFQYETQGVAPFRVFVIQFNNIPHYGGGNLVTAQVQLHESTNRIEIHTTSMPSDGGNHTQGIENDDGTIGHPVPGRSSTNWSATNDAYEFVPLSTTNTGSGPVVYDYYVEVTDTLGCTQTSNVVSVGEDTVSRPFITTNTSILCDDGSGVFANSATMSTINCTGCSYQWYQDDTLLIFGANSYQYTTSVLGSYRVEVTYANSCMASSSNVITISEDIFLPKIGPQDTVYICNGAPVTIGLEGSFQVSPTWSFQWYRNSVPIAGATGYNYDALTPGFYYVEVTNSNGCVSESNFIRVLSSSSGANPNITSSFPYLCTGNSDTIELSVSTCPTCSYDWRNASGVSQIAQDTNTFQTSVPQGYIVRVTDTVSGCFYDSPVFEVKDTTYPAPTINALSSVVCSPTNVVLSTPSCIGCDYQWSLDGTPIDTTTVNNYSATAPFGGNYTLRIIRDGCPSPVSNDVPITFVSINSVIAATPSTATSICNGDSILFEAAPDTAACPSCTYKWYRNNIQLPASEDTLLVLEGGDYELVITDGGGCSDTSLTRSLFDVSLATDLAATATAICGSVGVDTLSVDSCFNCSYSWYYDGDTTNGINYNALGQADTFYIVNGGAAAGLYQVRVEIAGCEVRDSIYLPLIPELDVNVSPNPAHATICDGVPVQLTAVHTPSTRPLRYQWYYNAAIQPGAITQTNLATVGGDYEVFAIDTFGCFDYSGTLNVGEIDPAAGFLLDFDSVSVIPLSHPNIDVTDYVTPASVYSMGSDTIYSVPQPAAIVGDSFLTIPAGPGRHFVTFEYEDAPCIFTSMDTIEVLSQMSLDVVNLNPVAPPYESCLNDDLQFFLNNFTFEPNQILFATSATTYDTLALSPAQVNLTPNAGVWTGTIDVSVPLGAVTGKVIFRDSIGGDLYQSPFFLVVQNPSVAISLNGVQQPLCSNDDTISLSGFPTPGTFKAAYTSAPTVYDPTLINGNNLVVENVINYDPFSRIQNLEVTYVYWPTYSNVITIGAAAQCPDSVVAILPVQVNNNELDSVVYTPISETEAVVPLANMTKGIYPLLNRNFPGNYIGTYVTNNNLLASTVPMPPATASVTDPVIYTFSNQSCSNSVSEDVEVWARPSILDSIPEWICRNADTVFIGRNASGLYAQVAGVPTPIIDANYALHDTIVSIAGVRDYQEKVNVLTINSTNGGLYTMPGSSPGNELFAFVPDSVQGPSTTLSLDFEYQRNGSYYIPANTADVVTYTIAYVDRVVNIEDPFVTEISPAILADTIFCQDNETEQFSGTPLGGQYYINGDTLVSNIFNPNQVASAYGAGTQELIYEYTGNACVDADTALINIPDTFSVFINAPTTYCRLDSAELITVNTTDVVDTAAGVFYVNYSVSGQIFNPAVSPAILGGNSVFYIASDTFGCQVSSDTIIFTVNPMPSISMTPLDPAYCLNAPADPIIIYEDTLFGPGFTWDNTIAGAYTGTYSNIQVTLTGNGIAAVDASNPTNPFYRPGLAGVGHDTVRYTFENTATGCSTTIEETTFVKALPTLSLFTYDAANNPLPLSNTYCEYDTIPIGISPTANPATDSIFSYHVYSGNWSPSFDTIFGTPHFAPIIPGADSVTVTEVLAYTYFDPLTACRDTIADTIIIRNMTTELEITGFPGDSICANDIIIPLGTNIVAQSPLNTAYSPGVFGALYPIDTAMIVDTVAGDFNPYLSGITDAGREVVVTYTYPVNGCTNLILDTVFLNPVPQLTYLQALNPDVQAPLVDNLIGDSLFNSSDPRPHICFSADPIQMLIQNEYYGVMSQINSTGYGGPPDTSITGWFSTYSGLGVVYDTAFGIWYYDTLRATGMDTLYFTYQDQNTCVNTLTIPVFIDTVPELGFAGYQGNYLGINDEEGLIHDYCENDASHLLIPTPFGGNTYWNYNPIPSILFELRPDTLVVGGVPTHHRLTYEFISARYENGRVCLDSIVDTIIVKPTPVLNMAASIPDFFCLSDPNQRLELSATPYGGYFEDATNNYSVLGGIVGDSIFVPAAQMGVRQIEYVYSDTVPGNLTGCADTLVHFISVYNMPDVGFETGGGCEGDTVVFVPDDLNLTTLGPAIDSITMVVWDYGDGAIDSLVDSTLNLINPLVVPNQGHIYTTAGVYYPSLTVVNRDGCDTTFSKRIVISPKFVALDTTPYFQDFENGPASWFQENGDSSVFLPTDSLWAWGLANGARITTANAGNHVWSTAPNGTYPQGQNAWVYSPCFDITDLDRPMVALDIWRDTREGVDGVVMQYFDEPSTSWKTLGIRGKGINWYNPTYVISAPGYQTGAPIGWSGSSEIIGGQGWEDARYRLDVQGGDLRYRDNLRFRIAFASTPNSVVGTLEGFAFDNFYLGDRQRSVLVEHFSNQNFPNISQTETALYNEIYSNLYGRDVTLIQYHIVDASGVDYLQQQASDENSARRSYYGITSPKQVRVNGEPLVSTTDSLINNALEILDMQMLEDAKYKIENPLVNITAAINEMEISADVIAIQDLPVGDYRAFTVVTEDSIVSLQNHRMLAVMRSILPDAAGDTLNSAPLAYADTFQIYHEWNYDVTMHDPNNLLVVFFVQNYQTKEVYQVATTRNLNIFTGPVSVEDMEDKDGLELLSLKLFPNPTRDQFFVEFSEHLQSEYDWQVVDVTGRVLKSGIASPGTVRMQVDTDNFSPGMYIFTIKNENVRIQRKVIIAK